MSPLRVPLPRGRSEERLCPVPCVAVKSRLLIHARATHPLLLVCAHTRHETAARGGFVT